MPKMMIPRNLLLLAGALNLVIDTGCASVIPRLDNGLAITPPMGWNSYNHYSCSPNESIIHSNAQALVDLGLQKKGYHFVTTDCGWTIPDRADGKLTWNTDRFPSGFPALGKYIHDRGLGFGVYSDSGIKMCMTGLPDQVGSLDHEQTDADTFASWGADLLKYDNCYSDAATGFPNVQYQPSTSPASRFKIMSDAILATGRDMLYQICEWGVDFPSAWAPDMGNTWRVTNDIIPSYRTIPRILNQVVPQTSFAGPGRWLDLDMLEVGNGIFTEPEEQTHFSLWAILKSPLFIGCALKDTLTSISQSSLDILGNVDVISYNQDSLGVAASFKRRWTSEGYEVWAGPLSGDRTVVAVINLHDQARDLTLNLPDVGKQTAGSIKDIWHGTTSQSVMTSYTGSVGAHGTLLLELSQTTAAGSYDTSYATTSGETTTFKQIYGATTSSNYTASFSFASSNDARTVNINERSYTIPAKSTSLLIQDFALSAGNTNSIAITPSLASPSLKLTTPPSTLYPATSFQPTGDARLTTCSTNLCAPVGSKIGFLSPSGSASSTINSPSSASAGSKYIDLYFAQNDVALATSWDFGTNTRNMTLSVNGKLTWVELPLSGRSSELFSPDLGYQDTGIFGVLVDGWIEGANQIVVGNANGAQGLVSYGADFIGLGVYW